MCKNCKHYNYYKLAATEVDVDYEACKIGTDGTSSSYSTVYRRSGMESVLHCRTNSTYLVDNSDSYHTSYRYHLSSNCTVHWDL